MSGGVDGICRLAWCDEREGHAGPHRRCLYDAFGLDVSTGRPVIVQVNLQGESSRTRALVLVTGRCETGLPWAMASKVGWLLYDRARMEGGRNTSR